MKVSRYFQFFLGIFAGFFLSSILFVLNGDYGTRMISSLFQLETGSNISDRAPQTSATGVVHHSDLADAVVKGGIVGRSTERILVKFKSNVGQERKNQILAERGSKENGNIPQIDVKFITIPPGKSPEEFVSDMKTKHGIDIEYAEVDNLVSQSYIPNDPYYASQWHHQNIQSSVAWDSSQGSGVTIAILDSGTDCTHPDLQASCVAGWNAYDNNSDTTDVQGHGTMVAGTAAAIGDNANGVSGVAYGAKIMPVRVADASGYAYYSTIATALTWATDHGAKVANISFAEVNSSSAIINAATYMRSKGGLVVVAEGNSGVQSLFTNPKELISVSATDGADNRTSWSTYGADTDLAAPGVGIYTTSRGGGYSAPSGTSFSSPLTAGVVALIFSVNPRLTPDQAQNILFTSADDIGEPGWDMYYGWGRINATKAVAAALSTVGTRDTLAPSVPTNLVTIPKNSTSIALSWNASTDIGGVTGYNIYRNGSKIATSTTQSYTDVSGLSASTAYTYTVSAYDAAGNTSAISTAASGTTLDVSLSFISNSVSAATSSATISWSTSLPTSGKVLYGTGAGTLSSSMISSQIGVMSDIITLIGLRNKTTYYYQVIITDSTGKTLSSAVSKFITRNR